MIAFVFRLQLRLLVLVLLFSAVARCADTGWLSPSSDLASSNIDGDSCSWNELDKDHALKCDDEKDSECGRSFASVRRRASQRLCFLVLLTNLKKMCCADIKEGETSESLRFTFNGISIPNDNILSG